MILAMVQRGRTHHELCRIYDLIRDINQRVGKLAAQLLPTETKHRTAHKAASAK